MAKKFNGFENHLITISLRKAIQSVEEEIVELERQGKKPLHASGYFTMVGANLLEKVNSMTYKKDLK